MTTKAEKWFAAGVAVMGIVHIIATFLPVIAGKMALLDESARMAFTYMSVMCGAFLVMGGALAYWMCDKREEHVFLRKPYSYIVRALLVDGTVAILCMPHNPCAWLIFGLSFPLVWSCRGNRRACKRG